MKANFYIRFARVSQSHRFFKPLLGDSLEEHLLLVKELVGILSILIPIVIIVGTLKLTNIYFLNATYPQKYGLQLTLLYLLITFLQKKMVFKCLYLFFSHMV
jgi:hypothetical protein